MKTKTYFIGLLLLLAGLFIATQHKTEAQGNGRVLAATVILGYKMDYTHESGRGLVEKGLIVTWADSSTSVIQIGESNSLAYVMAQLQNEGFQMLPQTARPELIFNRPPR